MAEVTFAAWGDAFLTHVRDAAIAGPLQDAALAGKLADWTASLTTAVVRSCESIGWRAAGKGHPLSLLPQVGQEYLSLDVMAFAGESVSRWPFPVAVFELENHAKDDRVAYSLWKVLCVRAELRVVFAYRPDWEQGRQLVGAICDAVISDIPPENRLKLKGETVIVVGNRGEGGTFPWGYFKFWKMDTNLGRFEKVD